MAEHLNLYTELHLDNHASSEALVAVLDSRLDADPTRSELITVARAILGNPARRHAYDSALVNPGSPTVDLVSLKILADTDPALLPAPPVTNYPPQAASAVPTSVDKPEQPNPYQPAPSQVVPQSGGFQQTPVQQPQSTQVSFKLKGEHRSDSILWISLMGILTLVLFILTINSDMTSTYQIIGFGGTILALNETIWALRRYVTVHS